MNKFIINNLNFSIFLNTLIIFIVYFCKFDNLIQMQILNLNHLFVFIFILIIYPFVFFHILIKKQYTYIYL